MDLYAFFQSEVKPTIGCTEPGAVAYAAAVAARHLPTQPEGIRLEMSVAIYKNGRSVGIPGTNGLRGLTLACVLGALGGNPDKGLMALEDIPADTVEQAQAFIDAGKMAEEVVQGTPSMWARVTLSGGGHRPAARRNPASGGACRHHPCGDAPRHDLRRSQGVLRAQGEQRRQRGMVSRHAGPRKPGHPQHAGHHQPGYPRAWHHPAGIQREDFQRRGFRHDRIDDPPEQECGKPRLIPAPRKPGRLQPGIPKAADRKRSVAFCVRKAREAGTGFPPPANSRQLIAR